MKTNLRLIGGRRLLSPNDIYTRPTTLRVREAIFNILKNKVNNSNWLDLFSGTGAISCEAYNHGASKIIACLLYTSPSPRDRTRSRMPSSA